MLTKYVLQTHIESKLIIIVLMCSLLSLLNKFRSHRVKQVRYLTIIFATSLFWKSWLGLTEFLLPIWRETDSLCNNQFMWTVYIEGFNWFESTMLCTWVFNAVSCARTMYSDHTELNARRCTSAKHWCIKECRYIYTSMVPNSGLKSGTKLEAVTSTLF